MASFLEVDEVDAGYGSVQVLFDVSLDVERGEALAIVGPNGAGKTTLLRTITGFVPVRTGSIRFDGRELVGLRPHAVVEQGISQVLQGRRLFAPMTVTDNLLLGAHHRLPREGRRAVEEAVAHCFELFPILEDRAALPAGSLSGGEQQMLAIARSLMADPRLLVLDEPSMGLAPFIVQQITETLLTLKNGGLTLLVVEQNPDLALNVADRVAVMETGRIVERGDASLLADRERVAMMYLAGDE